MNNQVENIDDLKNVVSFTIDAAESAERVLEDKKVETQETFSETMILVGKLSKLKNVKAAAQQTKHLKNPLKRQELIEFVKKDLDLKNDKVESLVEKSLELIKKASDVVEEAIELAVLYKEIREN
ncbi:hypothetical protein V9L05_15320 [Bernardetia sp. Wsw4-3y2]|uniref:hypothetical protein n=1 Tax=Bernardetia sp. Wsw4-3y2 TaxID=3127471 RepID=UPI0030D1152A